MDETLILNLVGTFAFGLSGGRLAVRKKMALCGVLVLAVATGLGGGIMRDLILGHTPPTTLVDWRYLAAAGVAGLLVFVDYRQIIRWNRFVTAFDAAGLAIFTVTGTTIASRGWARPGAGRVARNAHRHWWRSSKRCTRCGSAARVEKRDLRRRFAAGRNHNHPGKSSPSSRDGSRNYSCAGNIRSSNGQRL